MFTTPKSTSSHGYSPVETVQFNRIGGSTGTKEKEPQSTVDKFTQFLAGVSNTNSEINESQRIRILQELGRYLTQSRAVPLSEKESIEKGKEFIDRSNPNNDSQQIIFTQVVRKVLNLQSQNVGNP